MFHKSIYAVFILGSVFLFSINKIPQNYTYPFRDIKKPIVPLKDTKIIILSTYRVGSTLAYMVAQYLFESEIGPWDSRCKVVAKSHNFYAFKGALKTHPKTLFVIPVRDPMNTLSSMERLHPSKTPSRTQQKAQDILNDYKTIVNFTRSIPSKNIILCRYEDFTRDLRSLVEKFEEKLHITVSENEKAKINILFSRCAMQKLSDQLTLFSRFDPVLAIHGNHIAKEPRDLAQTISEDFYNDLKQKFQPIYEFIEKIK